MDLERRGSASPRGAPKSPNREWEGRWHLRHRELFWWETKLYLKAVSLVLRNLIYGTCPSQIKLTSVKLKNASITDHREMAVTFSIVMLLT